MRFAAVMLLVFCGLAEMVSAQKGLVASRSTFEFGKRPQADRFEGKFELVNRSHKTVVIGRVVPLCLCAKVRDFPRQIRPGQTGVIQFEFFTRQFEGMISKVIEVHYGELGLQRLVLRVRGEVVPAWRLQPAVLQLGSLASAKTHHLNAVIAVAAGQSFDIELSSRSHGITVHPTRIKAASGDVPIKITMVVNDRRRGEIVAEIAIKSSDPRKPEGVLRILGYVEGDLSVTPRRLSFGQVKAGAVASCVVRVSSRSQRLFQITGERTEGVVLGGGLKGKAARAHEIKLTLQPGLPVGPVHGRYILRTDHPEESEIVLEFSARIVKP